MPSRNTVKQFDTESMYHVYNRGVDKRIIFTDERDYAVFLSFLKYALLSDKDNAHKSVVEKDLLSEAERFNIRRLGLANSVELVSYCLMPNHFHLLVYQHNIDGITKLMRSVATGYSLYFNKRHGRSGVLFEGRYKASKIASQGYWDHISRYIHLNPMDLGEDIEKYPYSSYKSYLGEQDIDWLNSGLITDSFKSTDEYKKFVEDYVPHRKELKEIKKLLANTVD